MTFPTANLTGHWRADEAYTDAGLTVKCAVNGDKVYGLKDLSGNGRHLIQATLGQRPNWESSDGSFINAKPIVAFDGVDDFLICMDPTFIRAHPETVYLVVRWITEPNLYNNIFDATSQSGSAANRNCVQMKFDGGMLPYSGASFPIGGASTPGNTLAVGAYHRALVQFNQASSIIRVDAQAEIVGDAGSNGGVGLTLGAYGDNAGTYPVNAYVAEMLTYNAAHDLTTRDSVMSDLYAPYFGGQVIPLFNVRPR